MRKYSFLTTPRWVGLILLMIAASIACFFLGEWQYGRYEQKVAATNQIKNTWDNDAVSLDDITGPDNEWQLTTMTGEFVPDSQVLLRGRSVSGQAALHVIALFTTEQHGEALTLIIDRGWITPAQAESGTGPSPTIPALPTGTVTLEARMRTAESPHDRIPAEGYIYTLAPEQVLAGIPTSVTDGLPPVFDGRFELAPNQPGSDLPDAPNPYPEPSTSLGSHLAYAWEWRFFAVAALAVVPILARREASENSWVVDGVDLRELDLTEDELRDLGLSTEAKQKKRRGGPTDEDIEDQILDQASAISSK